MARVCSRRSVRFLVSRRRVRARGGCALAHPLPLSHSQTCRAELDFATRTARVHVAHVGAAELVAAVQGAAPIGKFNANVDSGGRHVAGRAILTVLLDINGMCWCVA